MCQTETLIICKVLSLKCLLQLNPSSLSLFVDGSPWSSYTLSQHFHGQSLPDNLTNECPTIILLFSTVLHENSEAKLTFFYQPHLKKHKLFTLSEPKKAALQTSSWEICQRRLSCGMSYPSCIEIHLFSV